MSDIYTTAATYENWERIGEPYLNDKDKLVTLVKETCPRCGGLGYIVSRVENGYPILVQPDAGVCYQCGGAKYIQKEVRLYTIAERERMDRANERAAAAKRAKADARMKAEYEHNKTEWLEKNGFDTDGNTYIIKGDSYSIKDELKSNGWRFDSTLLWHRPYAENYENMVVKVNVTELGQFTAWGKVEYNENAKAYIRSLTQVEEEIPDYDYYPAEPKERVRNVNAKVVKAYTFESRYGLSTVYNFATENGCLLVWFTSSDPDIDKGDEVTIDFTIKGFDEYKGIKQTKVTRVKIVR